MILETRLIYWLLSDVMGHLQVITLAEWHFIAPEVPVDHTFDLFIAHSTKYVVLNNISVGSGENKSRTTFHKNA